MNQDRWTRRLLIIGALLMAVTMTLSLVILTRLERIVPGPQPAPSLPAPALDLPFSIKAVKTIPNRIGQMFGTTPPTSPGSIWTTWEPWNLIETTRGSYNWSRIDNKIALAQAAGVKIQLQILAFVSTAAMQNGHYFVNYTPTGYAQGYTLQSGSLYAVVPAYDDSGWRAGYLELMDRLADRYDGNSTLVCVSVATGIDGETQAVKVAGIDWAPVMDQQAPGLSYRFNQWVYQAMDGYAASFNYTPLVLNNAPGGNARMDRADYAVAHGIGLKHSGLQPDIDSAKGYGTQIGSWDPMNVYSTTTSVPMWFESAHEGTRSYYYWGYYAALNFRADALDVHPEWFTEVDSSFRYWVESHLGRTVANTPSTFTAFRTMEYPLQSWGGGQGVSGWPGHFNFYQTVSNVTVVTNTVGSSTDWRYRHTGVLDGNALVNLDNGFAGRDGYTLSVVTFGQSDTLTVTWHAGTTTDSDTIALGTGWMTHTLDLPDLAIGAGTEITLTGDSAYIHRVEVSGEGNLTPTPTWTPGGPTATNTPLPTSTRTPTPTWTPGGVTATPSNTPTPVGDSYSVTKDTELDSWAPTTCYGDSTWLYIRQGNIKNALFEFDLGAIPEGATLTSAYLHTYILGRSNSGLLPVTIYPVIQDWTENQATWNIYSTSNAWATAGCDGVATDRLATPSDTYTFEDATGWAVINITDVAGYWFDHLTDPAQLIIRPDGSVSVQYQIASSEYADTGSRPFLALQFTSGPTNTPANTPTSTRTPTATPAPTSTGTVTPVPTLIVYDVTLSQGGTPIYSGEVTEIE